MGRDFTQRARRFLAEDAEVYAKSAEDFVYLVFNSNYT